MLRFLGLDGSSSDGVGRLISIGGRQLRLTRQLAEGGHATLFEAKELNSGELLVVKQIIAADGEAAELAEREILSHAALGRHEAVLPLLAETSERRRDGGGEYLLLLPLCNGGHLWDYASSTPMRPLTKLRALEQIAGALDFMHERCLAHMDVKLENVLVSSTRSGGAADSFFLCDFGSTLESPEGEPAGVLPSALDRRGRYHLEEWVNAHTTPMYRAPELCDLHSGLRVGPAADVWALGCLLYTLCFGAHPFAEASPVQIISGKWRVPQGAFVDDAFIALIRAMLRVDPATRPAAAAIVQVARKLQRRGGAGARLAPLSDDDIAQIVTLLKAPGAKAHIQRQEAPHHTLNNGFNGTTALRSKCMELHKQTSTIASLHLRDVSREPASEYLSRRREGPATAGPAHNEPSKVACRWAKDFESAVRAPLRVDASEARERAEDGSSLPNVVRGVPPRTNTANSVQTSVGEARGRASGLVASKNSPCSSGNLPGLVGPSVDIGAWQQTVARLAAQAEELRRQEDRLMRSGSSHA